MHQIHQAEAKAAALRDIPPPVGYRRCSVPIPSRQRSIVFDHGVKFEQDCTKPDPKKHKWFCCCSERCRKLSMEGKAAMACHEKGTGNVTRHLREAHSEIQHIFRFRFWVACFFGRDTACVCVCVLHSFYFRPIRYRSNSISIYSSSRAAVFIFFHFVFRWRSSLFKRDAACVLCASHF